MVAPAHGNDGNIRLHQCAFNARDIETLAAAAAPDAACFCDGEWVGAGRDAVRALLRQEYARNEQVVGRLVQLEGESVLAEFDGPDAQRPHGVLRFAGAGAIRELRIEHSGRSLERLGRLQS